MADHPAHPEDIREEMLAGKIIAMAPPAIRHNEIAFNIAYAFQSFLRGKPCKAYSNGVAAFLTEKDFVIPDAMIVCDQNKIRADGIHGAPDLIVEVLSPGSKKYDRGYKKQLYARRGVSEYWIVTPSDETIEVYLLENGEYRLDEIYQVIPENTVFLPGEKETFKGAVSVSLYGDFSIPLQDIFGNPF